jgi:hypothetical protein
MSEKLIAGKTKSFKLLNDDFNLYFIIIAVEGISLEEVISLEYGDVLRFIVRHELHKTINKTDDRDGLIFMDEKVKKKIKLLEDELSHWRDCSNQLQWLMNPNRREVTIGKFINKTTSELLKNGTNSGVMVVGDVFGELIDEFFPAKVFGHTLEGMYQAKESNNASESDDSEAASP